MSALSDSVTGAKRSRSTDDDTASDAPSVKRIARAAASEPAGLEPSYDAWHDVPARPVELVHMLNRAISVMRGAGVPPPVIQYCARKESVEMRWNAQIHISFYYTFDWFNGADEFTIISGTSEDPLDSMDESYFPCLDAEFDDAVLGVIRAVLPVRESVDAAMAE